MTYSEFLPRRVSQAGCIVAGTKLATCYDRLKQQKVKLTPKIDAAAQSVISKTRAVELLTSTDATMNEIDRGADRFIAACDDQLESIELSFDHASILPLSDEEAARLADAKLVRSAILA